MKLWITIFFLASMFSLNSFGSIAPKVIYGDDDRVDVYDTSYVYQELARSTAAMIRTSKLVFTDETYNITGGTLKQGGVCSSARFAKQLATATCSGFLVGEDLLVTAGHCMRYQSYCDNYKWVFDYAVTNEGQLDHKVGVDSVYGCKEIVDQKLDNSSMEDYALIRLDRPVVGRQPLKYRTSGEIEKDTQLVVIGHPSGLPTKIADNAYVRSVTPSKYFIANLDTFGGNSGSAVFNTNTLEIEGILVRGEQDYTYDPLKSCSIPRVCEMESCRGEDVTRITNIAALN